MKRNTKTAIWVLFALVASSLLGTVIVGAQEQSQPSPAVVPQTQAQPAEQPVWTADQLENLVAPIALYPDPLLSQVLVASTYPLEVVEASQWLDRNKNLHGQTLIDAAKKQPWDPSIQTLVTVPDALERLNEDIQWTTDLGNAFLSQESDVMNAVQRMRVRAEANGRLASTSQQKVVIQNQDSRRVIVIEPAYPDVVYVPVYDPIYVWGPPVYGYYPALYYPRYGFGFSIGFNIGHCFAGWGGWGFWGWGPSWHSHSVFVNNYFFNRYGFRRNWRGDDRGRMAWVHNPVHRMNVPYRNSRIVERFGGQRARLTDVARALSEQKRSGTRFEGRPENRVSGRNYDQGPRNASFQGPRYQSSARQRYQSQRQSESKPNQNRVTSRGERYQNREQTGTQDPQQYRSDPQRYNNEGPRVVPFGGQRESQNHEQRQYGSAPQMDRVPEVQRYQSMPQQRSQSDPQQYRSVPQTFSPPQAQQQRSMPQQRFEAAPQFRSAPQMQAPRYNGGGFSGRSLSGGNSSGGSSSGGSFSGGGSFNRGSDGGHNRSNGRGR
jgi:hypothetical protein